MARFWLATFEFERPTAPILSLAEPFAPADARKWAIEVIEDGKEIAVLVSTVDDADNPKRLVCQIGFANGSKSCSVWRDRGFPLVDAIIKVDRGDLTVCVTVCAACFLAPPEMNYEAKLISIKNIPLDDAGSFAELATLYEQKLLVPDSAFPATRIIGKAVAWLPERSSVKELNDIRLQFEVSSSRWPSLAFLKERDVEEPNKFWSGIVTLPQAPEFPRVPVERASRLPIFGEAEFRFEDVEVLGFRIDLTKYGTGDEKRLDDDLAELVKPLNFHLDPLTDRNSRSTRSAVSDFQYRPASRMLALELVRYGKMKLKKPSLPFTLKDFQSQHELLVRILVGRVDDDTAQAHDAATFVPAIFVDNPWSKVLGRAVEGFDKRMADFCVKDVMDNEKLKPLRPDGRLLPDDKMPQPLMSIAQIRLAAKTGEEPSKHVLVDLDCPSPNADDKDVFDKIDLNLVFGTFPFPPMRWRQTDFDEVEFQRSFARSVVAQTLKGLRSIQVSPIGERKLQQELRAYTTWIKGAFTYDNDMRVARPNGTVRLTFHAGKYAPPAWKALCKLLGINEARKDSISLPTGSWYRVRCSMDLKIDNGLD